jgi:putative protein-disulfide isomerase
METNQKINVADNTTAPNSRAGRLTLVYYTDPLCCWSWAFTPVLEKWLATYNGEVDLRYCMGGMLEGWDKYHDTVREVSKPVQMGPVWLEAKQMTGATIDDTIWFRDPPASSYPACLAVKCAQLQSAEAGICFLKTAQRAVMMEGKNIAKREILLSIAEGVAKEVHSFDVAVFQQQLQEPAALDAFKADVAEAKANNIVRFPSLLVSHSATQKKLMLTGYRPADALEQSIHQLLAQTA